VKGIDISEGLLFSINMNIPVVHQYAMAVQQELQIARNKDEPINSQLKLKPSLHDIFCSANLVLQGVMKMIANPQMNRLG
jgi:hypothetical protein